MTNQYYYIANIILVCLSVCLCLGDSKKSGSKGKVTAPDKKVKDTKGTGAKPQSSAANTAASKEVSHSSKILNFWNQ